MNMKKIMILLLSAFTLFSCKNDVEEVDWTVDTLAITSEGNQLQDAGDGNLKMFLPTEFSGVIKLNIESNNPWKAEVSDITIQGEQWITLSSTEGNGNGSFDINIAPNYSAADRMGSVVITTTGNIPVKKTVTLIQGNTDDMLSIGFEDIDVPDEVVLKEGSLGAWSMILPIDFPSEKQISVDISSTAYPQIEITYPEGLPTDWIQQSVATRSEKSIITFTVTENISRAYREALVAFTSRAGDVEVRKTLTVSQLGEENVIWKGYYFQGSATDLDKAEVIVPSNTMQDVEIAELVNIPGNYVEFPEQKDEDWFSVRTENNKVLLSVIKENISTNKENIKDLVLKSKLSEKEYKVTVRQCIPGYGIILNKKLWSAELANDYTVTIGGSVKKLEGLFDNQWSTGTDNKLYVEFSKVYQKKGVTIIFDLGENPHRYTHLGLLPRIEWVPQSPKNIKIDYSDDKQSWTEGSVQTAYTEAELKGEDGAWLGNQFDCKLIKWFEINNSGISSRYIRVNVADSFWSNGTYISFDEFFVSDKSLDENGGAPVSGGGNASTDDPSEGNKVEVF